LNVGQKGERDNVITHIC